MKTRKVKIEVGQIWRQKGAKVSYTITKIQPREAICQATPDNGITRFCYLDKGDITEIDDSWIMLPRECPCGIFRGDCDYHKL